MGKVKEIVNYPLFKAGIAAAIGIGLIAESHPLYAGMAFGYAVREFLLAFKEDVK